MKDVKNNDVIFTKSKEGKKGYSLPALDVENVELNEIIPEDMIRKETPNLPEVSEGEVMRHYVRLSTKNFGVDSGFYPLGSCTMKYNPKVNEDVASLTGLVELHPYQPDKTCQGALELMYNLEELLKEITGMDKYTMQPAAGAHGELTGLLMIRAYLNAKGEKRTKVICPDSAHGTNPASAAMAGFKVVTVKSNEKGLVDLDDLAKVLDDDVACLMLTNPNTLGLFESEIHQMASMVHDAGGLLYYDGANLNAIMGYARPGDMGFDVLHLNLHKTFSTPHGGGGPGSGPVGVNDKLASYLPYPTVEKNTEKAKEEKNIANEEDSEFYLNYDIPSSIGKVHGFHGNFNVLIKAYTYIRMMGAKGLKQVSEDAVLNANYLREKLKEDYLLPHDELPCKHEFVISGKNQAKNDVKTMDIAKRLLDYNVHPPTIYFPQIVEESMMVEPTETESKENLNKFVEIMKLISKEAKEDPDKVKSAPNSTPVGRLDEAGAARKPKVTWTKEDE
ncbi:aminomethyl-transferring glycine dehydrogenase subunit GcvPB [Natranaerofaba carboxydovora]|uniref:aminomethyl-transferring glycine dehydrogenase subunit GcvPB n=1 Tax=Natranaerofaba carboxydovora TaxID=2742683 RepID=UPI001F139A59|nr:aminomethyl-transferring glycine dehydrogenase subunit GcvPB [Natranaerofaba carboxydovora]UMZ73972.1 putative glycine dehydrogenase (decarboxylating) subunit 2 [Natranaerofaba carboxydovora]